MPAHQPSHPHRGGTIASVRMTSAGRISQVQAALLCLHLAPRMVARLYIQLRQAEGADRAHKVTVHCCHTVHLHPSALLYGALDRSADLLDRLSAITTHKRLD